MEKDVHNGRAKRSVREYCLTSHPREYALLVAGGDSSGKTRLVEDCTDKIIKKHKLAYVFVNIDLRSVANVTHLEQLITNNLRHTVDHARQFYNALSSTEGNDSNDDTETATKESFADKITATFNTTAGYPDAAVDYLSQLALNIIFIFDNIERCVLPPEIVFAHVEPLLKVANVIIISNEETLIKRVDNCKESASSYLDIKKKYIGWTVNVLLNTKPIFLSVVKEAIKDYNYKKAIIWRRNRILEIFALSQLKNLTILKRSIFEVGRILSLVDEEIHNNTKVIDELVEVFFVLYFEIASDNLTVEDIGPLLRQRQFDIDHNSTDEQQAKQQAIIEAQKRYRLDPIPFPVVKHLWIPFFETGSVDHAKVNRGLLETVYFINNESPPWRQIWHFINLEAVDLFEIYANIKGGIESLAFWDCGVIKHLAGVLFRLAKIQVIEMTENEILDLMIDYVNRLKGGRGEKSLTDPYREDANPALFFYGAYGLEYYAQDSLYFNAFCQHLDQVIYEEKHSVIVEKNYQILEDIEDLPTNLMGELIENKELTCPGVSYFPPEVFTDTFFRLSNADKIIVTDQLVFRLENLDLTCKRCQVEKKWFLDIIAALHTGKHMISKRLDLYCVKVLIEKLDAAYQYVDSQ